MAKGGRKNAKYRGFRAQAPLEAPLVALGVRQHAVLGLDQLRDLGLSARAVQDRARQGRLHHLHRAVYSLVPRDLLGRDGLYMAAVLACGPGALLSHRSAAALHGLQDAGGIKIDVTVPTRTGRRRHAGVAVHRSTTLTATDATVVNNIPCTTVARTLFDVAEMIGRRSAERAFDQAEVMQVFDLRAIQDQLERNPTRAGAQIVKAILDEHYIGSTLTASDLEEDMLALSRATGLPLPRLTSGSTWATGSPRSRSTSCGELTG